MIAIGFDLLIAFVILFLACLVLKLKDLYLSVLFFLLFGLLCSFSWLRMNATDIALVEAAIGSAFTGALFLGCIARLEKRSILIDHFRYPKSLLLSLFLIALPIVYLFVTNLLSQEPLAAPLTQLAYENLALSGSKNPVTSVLLNFRAYDTFFEIGVLLFGLIGVLVITKSDKPFFQKENKSSSQILDFFIAVTLPMIVLVSVYQLWVGTIGPGGAFQAASIFTGGAIMLFLIGQKIPSFTHNIMGRLLLGIGFLVFLIAGVICLFLGKPFLEFGNDSAKLYILFIEIFATLSIALVLISIFCLCIHKEKRPASTSTKERVRS